jgi:hypothetical protein
LASNAHGLDYSVSTDVMGMMSSRMLVVMKAEVDALS